MDENQKKPEGSASLPLEADGELLPPETEAYRAFQAFTEFLGPYEHGSTDVDVPNRFLLNLGEFNVGQVEMKWHMVFGFIIWLAHDLNERAGIHYSIEEIKEQLHDVEVDKSPLFNTLRHIYTHLPEKLNQSLRDLFLEAHQIIKTDGANEKGLPFQSYSQFADWVAEDEKKKIMARMNASGRTPKSKRGRRSKWTSETLLEAMEAAVRSLKETYEQSKRNSTLTWVLLAKELKKRHPDKQSGVGKWDTLRHTVKDLGLRTEWERLKSDWAIWAVARSTSKMESNHILNSFQGGK